MVFSSLVFLCVFLPVAFALDRVMPTVAAKNAVLIAVSLVFYAYGEPVLVLLMLASTLLNYFAGVLLGSVSGRTRRVVLVSAVAANLAFLGVFKYAGMAVSTLDALLGVSLPVPQLPLPLGISFYTFQALSYVVDVYRGDVAPQRSYARVLLYIAFFPQLVAGPIVKYHDIELQMTSREETARDTALGLRRFVMGLSKKVLVANTMAAAADALFSLRPESLNAPGAWLAAFAYLMQIYFDFSGYSDMAIGLARMFGFSLKENFDHPYSATSVREFWRRWHMSLSTWLKEYVYIPLGGNRKGKARAALNRIVVFFLCGLWHGANWTFVVWGLLHGLFLLVEGVVDVRRLPRALGHAYTLLFVMLAFVVFRCDSLGQSAAVLRTMLCGWELDAAHMIPVAEQLTPLFVATAAVAVALSGSLPWRVAELCATRLQVGPERVELATCMLALPMLALCMVVLSSGTYNPFIYFRF